MIQSDGIAFREGNYVAVFEMPPSLQTFVASLNKDIAKIAKKRGWKRDWTPNQGNGRAHG